MDSAYLQDLGERLGLFYTSLRARGVPEEIARWFTDRILDRELLAVYGPEEVDGEEE